MAIQHTQSSGSSNGILNFLFQDDGSTDGMVLEGAEFAKTLHQLLGDYDGSATADAPVSPELATVITDTEAEFAALTTPQAPGRRTFAVEFSMLGYRSGTTTVTPAGTDLPGPAVSAADATTAASVSVQALVGTDGSVDPTLPLSRKLDKLAGDFALPDHGATLPAEAGWEGDAAGQEVEQPFSALAPLTDVMAALHAHTDVPAVHVAAVAAKPADAAADAGPRAPAFGSGIQHLIELARDVQDVASVLNQAPAVPAQPLINSPGRNLPAGGKFLPQSFRPPGFGQAAGAMHARTMQTAANDIAPTAAGDMAAGQAFAGFITDLTTTESRTPQGNVAAPTATVIQGLRGESTLPNLPPVIAESGEAAPANQFQSEFIAGSDAWFEDLGTRVEWLKDMNIEQADLQLHPAELGVLEIHISTADDATTVSFVTHNAAARELIEESLPKLRELLGSQGMQLGESQVSQHPDSRRQGHESQQQPAAAPREQAEAAASKRRTGYVADPNRIDHYV